MLQRLFGVRFRLQRLRDALVELRREREPPQIRVNLDRFQQTIHRLADVALLVAIRRVCQDNGGLMSLGLQPCSLAERLAGFQPEFVHLEEVAGSEVALHGRLGCPAAVGFVCCVCARAEPELTRRGSGAGPWNWPTSSGPRLLAVGRVVPSTL